MDTGHAEERRVGYLVPPEDAPSIMGTGCAMGNR